MCKVYLYSRVSTSAQTLAQQERTAYEWLNAHNMKVDEVVSDEGISGGVSYAERNLGKVLLPQTKEGDMIIVSEISRLGRSMFDLSKLIHTELKPRKLRLVVVSMGIDLNCAKMTAIDELILNNFSFAAQLEKQLISERTLSALAVKRKQGVKFGAASDKYKEAYKSKTKEERKAICVKKGKSRNARHLESKEVQMFKRILRNVFAEHTKDDDMANWNWKRIKTTDGYRQRVLSQMRDYREIDGSLFVNWDFKDLDSVELQRKLSNYIYSLKRSMARNISYNQ